MAFLFRRKKKSSDQKIDLTKEIIDYRAVASTDVGSIRDNNEDNLIFSRPFDKQNRATYGCLAVVADGMGGHKNGELASKMATEIITNSYYESENPVLEALKSAFEKANKTIFQKAASRTSLSGMGTTCTAVVLLGSKIFLGHVGDSRAYLFKKGELLQLSKDHTYVQHLLDNGKITKEESTRHPQRNVVTQAMGTNQKMRADFIESESKFEKGDRLLICSDGLYDYFNPGELKEILSDYDLHESAEAFIDLAKKRGGHDNISVLIIETFSPDPEQISKKTQKLRLS